MEQRRCGGGLAEQPCREVVAGPAAVAQIVARHACSSSIAAEAPLARRGTPAARYTGGA